VGDLKQGLRGWTTLNLHGYYVAIKPERLAATLACRPELLVSKQIVINRFQDRLRTGLMLLLTDLFKPVK
jgi:hypothetical protein